MKAEHCLVGIAPTLEVKTGEIWGCGVPYTKYVEIGHLWHPLRWHCNTRDEVALHYQRSRGVMIVKDTTELASHTVNVLLRTNVLMHVSVLEHMLK